jgi:cold-inducible RNA-binding protein
MNAKLYVGNLDYAVTADQLSQLFSQVGEVVDSVVITDRQTGRSKGFGFVQMKTDEQAQEAVKTLNETEFQGRKLRIDVARPKRE